MTLPKTPNPIRDVLEACALRALMRGTGRDHGTMEPDERAAALEPLRGALEHDERVLRVLVQQAAGDAISRMRAQLHGAPGVDHEMLDQAIEFATSPRGGWTPK